MRSANASSQRLRDCQAIRNARRHPHGWANSAVSERSHTSVREGDVPFLPVHIPVPADDGGAGDANETAASEGLISEISIATQQTGAVSCNGIDVDKVA